MDQFSNHHFSFHFSVQPYSCKYFEDIDKIQFIKSLDITRMKSNEDEIIEFKVIISTGKARDQVEKRLLELECVMIVLVDQVIVESMADYQT